MNGRRPGWREPMVWLLLAIPASTVVAGFGTLRIAGGGLDAAPEPVRRTAQAQVADLAPDVRAARSRLRAVVELGAHGRVVVAAPVASDAHALTLRFVHATRADRDRAWTRAQAGAAWHGPAAPDDRHGRWILEDPVDGWRLVGTTVEEGEVHLEPAVATR